MSISRMKTMNNVLIVLCLTITTATSSTVVKWSGTYQEIIEYSNSNRLVLRCKTSLTCNEPDTFITRDDLLRIEASKTPKPIISDRFEQNVPLDLSQRNPASQQRPQQPQDVQQRLTTTRRPSIPLTADEKVANGILQMGINIFGLTSSASNDDIQVISPVSIAEATSLIQLGAKGETLKELMKLNGQTIESNKLNGQNLKILITI